MRRSGGGQEIMRWPEKGWRDKVRVQGLDEGYECGAGLWRVGGRNTVRDYVGVRATAWTSYDNDYSHKCCAAFSIKKQRPHCCMNCCCCMGSAAAGKPRHKLKKTHDHQEEAEPEPRSPATCSLLQPRPPATQLRTPAPALLRSLLRRGAAAALQEPAHEVLLLMLLVLMLLMLIAKKACATRLAGRQVHENRRSASTRRSSGLRQMSCVTCDV